MPVQSYKTAIRRKGLSAPMRRLRESGRMKGRVLDFGCGQGHDADILGVQGYDPHWRPSRPRGKFDTITCNYVLNVLRLRKDREEVLKEVLDLLSPGGIAYVTVRRDVKGCYKTTKGWQVNVRLKAESLWKNEKYETYMLKG